MTIPEDNPDNIQKKANLEALMEKHNFNVEYIVDRFPANIRKKWWRLSWPASRSATIVRMGKRYMIPSLVKQDLFWPVR